MTQEDQLFRFQCFMQEAGKIFNLLHDSDTRLAVVQYCLWIRDCRQGPEPGQDRTPLADWTTVEATRRKIDELAAKHLGE